MPIADNIVIAVRTHHNERQVNIMGEYRIQVFHGNTSNNYYFVDRDEAIIYGAKQLAKQSVTAVFLLSHPIDGKYDVEMQIK